MTISRALGLLLALLTALLQGGGAFKFDAKNQPRDESQRIPPNPWTSVKSSKDDAVLKRILPLVTFECKGKTGYFADMKFDCEVFHYCKPDGSRNTFHCPAKSVFNQKLMVCEVKTSLNSHLCKESHLGDYRMGKVATQKMTQTQNPETGNFNPQTKQKQSNHGRTSEHLLFAAAANNSTSGSLKVMLTLEDLLSYMNLDFGSKTDAKNANRQPSFVSTFHQPSADHPEKTASDTKVFHTGTKKNPNLTSKQIKQSSNAQSPPKSEKQTLENNAEDVDVAKSLQSKKRQNRESSRKGRVLNMDESTDDVGEEEPQHPRHGYSHVSVRSPAENSGNYDQDEERRTTSSEKGFEYRDVEGHGEDMTRTPTSSKPARLFSVSPSRRNATRGTKKRRRFFRRRKKQRKSGVHLPSASEEIVYDGGDSGNQNYNESVVDVSPRSNRDRHFSPPVDHNVKSDTESGWQGFSRLPERQKDPPSQPPPHPSSAPLALPQTDKRDEKPKEKHVTRFEEIDPNSNTSRSNGTSGNGKNPWFKGFTVTADEKGNFRFGDRTASGPGSAIEPFYGDEIEDIMEFHEEESTTEVANKDGNKGSHGGPQVSEEVIHEKKQERVESRQRSRKPSNRERAPTRKTHAQHQDPRPTVRMREKESSSGWRVSGGERDRKQEVAPHTLFPPPRAPMTSQAPSGGNSDARWNTFVPPMQQDGPHRFTTPYPPRSTPPDVGPYHPDLHHLVEMDEARWKGIDHHEDPYKQKIRVGSSFANSRGKTTTTPSTTTTTTSTTTAPPKIIPPSVPPFVKNLHRNRKKEWPKHTEAHQQLSKMLNDFFGLSSKHPDILKFNTEPHLSPHQFKAVTPRYRIPNEDIYESEPKPKERIKLPPGLLDFLESYTSEKPREKQKQKINYQIHEHIDLKSPLSELLEEDLKKILATEKPKQTLQVKDIPDLLMEALAPKQTSVPKQKDDLKEFADIAKFAYMHLEPLLSSVLSSEKSSPLTSTSKDKTRNRARRPAVITAKKVPIRVIYADNLRNMEESRPFGTRIHPNVKILRPNIPRQNFQPAVQSAATMVPSPSSEVVVLHPPSLRPPHPPPLPPRNFSPMNRAAMNHRRAALKPMTQNLRYFPYRRRRSRRQKRQINQQLSPFANNFFPSFNPNVFGTIPSFRNLFGSQRGLTSNGRSSLRFPFGFPSPPGSTLRPPKPNGGRRPVFLPRQPVQTIPQPAPQTVIVEEVPVPVPVPVPDHLPLQHHPPGRPPQPGGILRPPPGPRNPTPATFRQPRIFPQLGVFGPNQPGRPILNGNGPPAMLSSRRPPGIPHSLSSGIRDQPLAFAIPVTSGPFPIPAFPSRPNHSPGRNVPVGSGPLKLPLQSPVNDRKPPQPPHLSSPFEIPEFVQVNSYPNFPYFQSVPHSHTPINHPGSEDHSKLMHSGYKPPQQSSESSRPPKPIQNHYPRQRPEVIPHVELPPPPSEEKPSDFGVTQSSGGLFVVSPPDAKTFDHGHHKHQENIRLLPSKPNLDDDSKESGEMAVPKQRLTGGGGSSSSSEEVTGRRRRPGARRRRPRPPPPSDIPPYVPTDGAENSGPIEILVTPAPPQQIPPPPSEFTSGPFRPIIQHGVNDVRSGLQQLSIGGPLNSELTTVEAQGLYPPAGYYGREQLSQFFDPSVFVGENRDNSRPFSSGGVSHQQPTEVQTPTSTESSTSLEEPQLDDDGTGDGKVPFGTRLRSRDRSRGSTRSKVASPSGSQSGQGERSNKRQRNQEANDQGSRRRPVRLRDPDPENKQRQNGRDENQQQRRKPGGFRHQASVDRPQAIYDLQGVQPDVIYYDPRDQQMRYYNTPGVDSEIRLPSTSSQQSNQRERDIYTVPRPYLNGGTYNTPPTSQPEYNTRYINIPGQLPEPPPQQQKEPITSNNGNGGFGMLFSAPQGGFVPSTPPGSGLAEKQNQQQPPRNRERKRQTLPPPVKNENRPHSTVSTTKSRPKPTPSLYHSQQQHRQNQDHQQQQRQNHDHHQQQLRQNQDQQQQRQNQYHQQQPQPPKTKEPSTPSRWQGRPTTSPTATTTTTTTTHVYRPTPSHNNPDNTKKEAEGGFKPSNLPSSQQSTKPFLEGKIEIQKLNATTSTSVSVSGLNITESQEQQPKRVFSSKNGGLAVVRKGPRHRKRVRTQKVATSTSKSEESNSSENGLNNDERLQIAASILDIIKATTETEKQQGSSTVSSKSVSNHTGATDSSKTAKSWILQPPLESVQLNKES